MFKWSRDEVIEYLKTKAENIIFKVKSVRNTRTLQQNKYMHAIFWICGEIIYNISWDSDFTAEGTKQYFKQRFLWTRKEWQDGEIYVFTPSTADLDTKEIKEFIDKIDEFMQDNFDFTLPKPDDKNLLEWLDNNNF